MFDTYKYLFLYYSLFMSFFIIFQISNDIFHLWTTCKRLSQIVRFAALQLMTAVSHTLPIVSLLLREYKDDDKSKGIFDIELYGYLFHRENCLQAN